MNIRNKISIFLADYADWIAIGAVFAIGLTVGLIL